MSKTLPDTAPAPAGHPPAWLLERLAFEPEAADAGARHHLEGCPICGAAVTQLTEGRRLFLAGHPARPFLAGVEERARLDAGRPSRWWPPGWWSPRWLLAPAVAAAAALLVLALPPWTSREDAVRAKGAGVALRIFVAHDGAVARPFEPGAALRPGDLLRFGVVTPAAGHAFVASIDEAGRFSRYYPAQATVGVPLHGSGGLQLLPGSIELDETTGREWIVLFLSPVTLAEEAVRQALQDAWRARQGDRLGPLDLRAEAVVIPVTKAAR